MIRSSRPGSQNTETNGHSVWGQVRAWGRVRYQCQVWVAKCIQKFKARLASLMSSGSKSEIDKDMIVRHVESVQGIGKDAYVYTCGSMQARPE